MANRKPLFNVFPPRVESEQSLDLLLAELSRLESLEKHVEAGAQKKIHALTAAAQAELTLDVGAEKPMPLADWRTALEEAAEKFCTKHRDTLIEDGKRSRKFNHGTIGWRKQKAVIEAIDDFPAGGNPKLLDGMMNSLRTYLPRLIDFVTGAARFVELKLSWRKTELLKAYKDGAISAGELKKTGFTVDDPGERFFIEVEAGEVESQSAERPT